MLLDMCGGQKASVGCGKVLGPPCESYTQVLQLDKLNYFPE